MILFVSLFAFFRKEVFYVYLGISVYWKMFRINIYKIKLEIYLLNHPIHNTYNKTFNPLVNYLSC